jgi:hypothetical protein
MSKTFSAADVATHNKANNLYIIVDEDVYDLTTFQDEHPGELCCFRSFRVFKLIPGLQVERRVSVPYPPTIVSPLEVSNQVPSPSTSRRQGRFEAILEIPQ